MPSDESFTCPTCGRQRIAEGCHCDVDAQLWDAAMDFLDGMAESEQQQIFEEPRDA